MSSVFQAFVRLYCVMYTDFGTFFSFFQDDAEFKKARGAELEYESLKVSSRSGGK